jgi:DNA polymerase elongation subunit (family B)
MSTPKKRLYFDIEVSPNIGLFWEAGYKKNIDHSNIIKERAIICICYKWEGEKEVHSLHWDAKQSDKKLLEQFIKVANTAQELVGHNGDRYDLAFVRTRCLFHGIHMFPNYVTIDTLKISRSKFKFNSNKLDYIAQFLGMGSKIKTEFGMWKDILLNKDNEAMDKMIKYCKMDVILLEKVHNQLATHILPKVNYAIINGGDRGSCPECGSNDLVRSMPRISATGVKKITYNCKNCHKFHTKLESNETTNQENVRPTSPIRRNPINRKHREGTTKKKLSKNK